MNLNATCQHVQKDENVLKCTKPKIWGKLIITFVLFGLGFLKLLKSLNSLRKSALEKVHSEKDGGQKIKNNWISMGKDTQGPREGKSENGRKDP